MIKTAKIYFITRTVNTEMTNKQIVVNRIFRILFTAVWLTAVVGCGGAGVPPKTADALESGEAQTQTEPVAKKLDLPKAGKGVPDWVSSGGESTRHPASFYIVGFAMATGDNALESAKAAAAGDLANRIQVRIEHELRDVSAEKNGVTDYQVASITRTTSDIRIQGIAYELYQEGDKTYALAFVAKEDAVRERRRLRDTALIDLRACLKDAAEKKRTEDKTASAEHFETCRKFIAEALENDALVRVVVGEGKGDRAFLDEILSSTRTVNAEIDDILRSRAGSLRQAVESLALQLRRQGADPSRRWVFAPLTYGTTDFSSPFGNQAAADLEGAVARLAKVASDTVPFSPDDPAIRGFFTEEGDLVRISVTAKSIQSGKLLANAETTVQRSVIPSTLPIKPRNFDSALSSGKLLAEGELVDGNLRLEIWCDKGRRGAVYYETEAMRLYLRVNQPAYVRLVYVLENGAEVPIDQGYYIDSSKVNMAVEYPDEFEVVPPFGIEHIHAAAFTKKPQPLPTEDRLIDGQRYEVAADGIQSMIRHRGIVRKSKDEVAETMLSITTMPR